MADEAIPPDSYPAGTILSCPALACGARLYRLRTAAPFGDVVTNDGVLLTPVNDAIPARKVWDLLRPHFMTQYDDAQSIGRRYRRQDEIGTPFAVTVDFDTLDDKAVTVRERDTMSQERVSIDRLPGYLAENLLGA